MLKAIQLQLMVQVLVAFKFNFYAVVSVSGDVVYVLNGIYKENLPLRVHGVTLRGESLRGTELQPASGTGTQIKTVSINTNVSGSNGTYNYVHANATSGSGVKRQYLMLRCNIQ